LITVSDEAGQLVLTINDDGEGYPCEMIERQADYVQGINQSSGSTGLGLYFAGRIAALHQRNGVGGNTRISNGGPLGGGAFSLYCLEPFSGRRPFCLTLLDIPNTRSLFCTGRRSRLAQQQGLRHDNRWPAFLAQRLTGIDEIECVTPDLNGVPRAR
jgi:hypothetical protein